MPLQPSYKLLSGHFSPKNIELVYSWWQGLTEAQQDFCTTSLNGIQIYILGELSHDKLFIVTRSTYDMIHKVLAHSIYEEVRKLPGFPSTEIKLGGFK